MYLSRQVESSAQLYNSFIQDPHYLELLDIKMRKQCEGWWRAQAVSACLVNVRP
jgi:hypothetical protein